MGKRKKEKAGNERGIAKRKGKMRRKGKGRERGKESKEPS